MLENLSEAKFGEIIAKGIGDAVGFGVDTALGGGLVGKYGSQALEYLGVIDPSDTKLEDASLVAG